MPMPVIAKEAKTLKNKENIIVNCQSGWRARLGYSILQRNGIEAAILDDEFLNYGKAGAKIVEYQE